MWAICKKELGQFFSSLTGYSAIAVFLLANGLVLFLFRNNILDEGYASLAPFFNLAPWILLLLIPAVTMRSFSDEYRSGTFELLRTLPLSARDLVIGKFLGSYLVVLAALVPTLIYYFTINHLAATEGIDAGAAAGSYLGLALLAAVFTAIGVCVSSFFNNAVLSFLITVVACALLYYGFSAVSALVGHPLDYYLSMLGIDFHYQSISRGVVDSRDIIYFASLLLLLYLITKQNIAGHQ